MSSRGNILVMQSGGCTPVINRSLYGVVSQALSTDEFCSIFGAIHGVEGLLSGNIVDLGRVSRTELNRISRTPGAALGSTRQKLNVSDIEPILEQLRARNIRSLFTIGGNDSAETGHSLHLAANNAGYELAVVNVPKTIDNDLTETDHCPGYGSAARFIALATFGAGQDARSMGRAAPITIIEVMGRDTGWLPAAAALVKRNAQDAPHIICTPELPLNEDHFYQRIEEAYRNYGFAVAVIAENTRGPNGVLGEQEKPWFVDDFGHGYYDGPARYLASRVSQRLKVRARDEKPGTIQRSFVSAISSSDAKEAEMVGRAAVTAALDGHSDVIVTLVRDTGRQYKCTVGLAPLDKVAGLVRQMPAEFLDADNLFVTRQFLDYARPLVGRLPIAPGGLPSA